MVFIPRWERYRDRRPVESVEINWASDLLNGCASLAFDGRDLVKEANLTSLSTDIAEHFKGNTGNAENGNSGIISLFAKYTQTTSTANHPHIMTAGGVVFNSVSDNKGAFLFKNHADNKICFGLWNNNVSNLGSSGAHSVASSKSIVGRFNGTTRALFIDGKSDNSVATTTYLAAGGTGYYGSMEGNGVINTEIGGVWHRALTSGEIMELYLNPWQLLKPRRKYWLISAIIRTAEGALSCASGQVSGDVMKLLKAIGASEAASVVIDGNARRVFTSAGELAAANSAQNGDAKKIVLTEGDLILANSDVAGLAERTVTVSGELALSDSNAAGEAQRQVKTSGEFVTTDAVIDGSTRRTPVAVATLDAGATTIDGSSKKTLLSDALFVSEDSDTTGSAFKKINSIGDFVGGDSTIDANVSKELFSEGTPLSGPSVTDGIATIPHKAQGTVHSGASDLSGVIAKIIKSSGDPAAAQADIAGTLVKYLTTAGITPGDILSIANAVWNHGKAHQLTVDIAFIRAIEGGRWKIVSNQMIFYAEDNVAEVARFNLKNAQGQATMTNPMERFRV